MAEPKAIARVTIHHAALDHLTAEAAEHDLRRRGIRVLNEARRLVPVDKGRLRSDLDIEFVPDHRHPSVRIGSNLPYALPVHNGTGVFGPHGQPIVPVSARFLRFRNRRGGGGGPWVFALSVRGSPGRPYLLRALPKAND